MFCRNCGKDQPDSVESCGLCGHPTGVSKKTSSLPYAQEPNKPQPVSEYSPTPYIPPPEYNLRPSVGQQPYGAPQQPYGAPPQPYGGPPPMGQDPPVDDGFKMLMYIVSFLFPIAGIIVGIVYNSKPELHHKEFGKNCLMIAIGTTVIGCFCYMISMGAMFSAY